MLYSLLGSNETSSSPFFALPIFHSLATKKELCTTCSHFRTRLRQNHTHGPVCMVTCWAQWATPYHDGLVCWPHSWFARCVTYHSTFLVLGWLCNVPLSLSISLFALVYSWSDIIRITGWLSHLCAPNTAPFIFQADLATNFSLLKKVDIVVKMKDLRFSLDHSS